MINTKLLGKNNSNKDPPPSTDIAAHTHEMSILQKPSINYYYATLSRYVCLLIQLFGSQLVPKNLMPTLLQFLCTVSLQSLHLTLCQMWPKGLLNLKTISDCR